MVDLHTYVLLLGEAKVTPVSFSVTQPATPSLLAFTCSMTACSAGARCEAHGDAPQPRRARVFEARACARPSLRAARCIGAFRAVKPGARDGVFLKSGPVK